MVSRLLPTFYALVTSENLRCESHEADLTTRLAAISALTCQGLQDSLVFQDPVLKNGKSCPCSLEVADSKLWQSQQFRSFAFGQLTSVGRKVPLVHSQPASAFQSLEMHFPSESSQGRLIQAIEKIRGTDEDP